MDDDFNTAKVVGDLSEVFKLINEILDKPRAVNADADADARTLRAIRDAVDEVGGVLGLFVDDPAVVLARMEARKQSTSGVDSAEVEALIEERFNARKSKNWARADEIRDELSALGVVLKDSSQGTTWELA